MDNRTVEERSRIMRSVKQKDTGPEMKVRRLLHAQGYRFRLHRRDLPGSPDVVLPGRRKAIFVHGCFWHAHDCPKGRAPKSKLDYWAPKLAANVERDARKRGELESLGWDVLTVWQCQTGDLDELRERLVSFVENLRDAIDNPARVC
ncbi:very short patch repair endonuclease [Thalassococcus sp. S3]|uniref:very short patch repair endonuclease n=1 Tax=Thalassococcus sp. S3 TaxID=2017482 RepID=UPI0010240115|nr:very short patch repair endonuclease [Thalassococcus sp. S3]QBF30067.1 very short patch repair endonuclease [Thalassococcus sp. S3]